MVQNMHIMKDDGKVQIYDATKLSASIQGLCGGLDNKFIVVESLVSKISNGLYDGVKIGDVCALAAEVAASMTTKHPDYALLAGRIAVARHHKTSSNSYLECCKNLYFHRNPITNVHSPLIRRELYFIVLENARVLNCTINYQRDFSYSFFGYKTLERSYLLKDANGKIMERPQDLLMRVSLGIHGEDVASAIETYKYMSNKWFTHASPTLFNAGTPSPQLASCFLLSVHEDSIECTFETLKKCAKISDAAGGIGISVHKIQASGSSYGKHNVGASGLVPMLRIYNNTARFVSQGGRRPGAFAIYLEPWHADILNFIDLKKNTGPEDERARDLFYALWIPDLFMKRVELDMEWSLMCPKECPGLADCWGENFEFLYCKYEKEGRAQKKIKARVIWKAIIVSQIETGTPYMLYKDSCNSKSNQKNLGTITCSNLCSEIIEYSSADEIAVCNLASISLPRFVKEDLKFDYEMLHRITQVVCTNLNKVIDVTSYPVREARTSNERHRPIGIGVQGLADTFQLMRLPFASDGAKITNKLIFETIYHGALVASCNLAKKFGVYESYNGSPMSTGIFQQDMWGVMPSSLWNWNQLRLEIAKYGVRNSLLVAPMPTASTAQILGNNESTEPFTSNVYSRRVLSGDFQIVNSHLLKDLISQDLWNENIKNHLIANNGSVQNIQEIPDDLKLLYKTCWEIPQRDIIDMAADRAPYIDQSQSLNIHIATPSYAKCTSMHMYAWKKGLKTGMYYLRSRPAVDAVQFTVDKTSLNSSKDAAQIENNDIDGEEMQGCLMCSG